MEAGLVRRNARQRLDSTQVFGLISRLSRVEGLRHTLRLALEELADGVDVPARPKPWGVWWSLYVESQLDYRASREVLGSKMAEAGAAAARVLARLKEHPRWAAGEQTRLLARVFAEQFVLEAGEFRPRGKGELDSGRVQNSLDPECTYGVKQQGGELKSHVGYKAQVAETVVERALEPGEPTSNFITAIAIQTAHRSDEAGTELIAKARAALGLEPPPVLYADGAYVSGAKLVEAAAQGRELIGPVQAAPRRHPDQFTMEDFQVEVEQRQATCPAGRPNHQCSRLDGEKNQGAVQYRFEWNSKTCTSCELRERFLGKGIRHKSIVVGEHHSALQARRREQKSERFRLRLRHRAAIEGTQSELVRAHGLRRARYRGRAKVQLQA